jgi:hypothetical protein
LSTLFPITFLLAVGMIFASVSSVLSADRAKARAGRWISILSALLIAATAASALFVPGDPRLTLCGSIAMLGFAATIGLCTWLNLRRQWPLRRLLLKAYLPGLVASVTAAAICFLQSQI